MTYIHLGYRPKNDIVCEFSLKPKGNIKDAANSIAAESSIGTWTEVLTSRDYVRRLGAKVFYIKGNRIKIAYPEALFEADNMPQILSSVAGNIFGMKDVEFLRLEDIHFPKSILKHYKGPEFGINGIRKLLRVKERPLVGTIIKPKIGLNTHDHSKVAYASWIGGCDIVKDDENLSSQHFNPFEKRVIQTLEMRDEAESETGEKKIYMPNVTAETSEMIKRAAFVKSQGGEYVMVDIITCGFSSLQSLRKSGLKLVIHAHRAMHAAITRNPNHGISMLTIAKISRMIGVDQLHTGTIVGKLEGGKEIITIDKEMRSSWHGIKPVFPVASGGLYPGHIPDLVKFFGKDIIIQMGGGIHGHPHGTISGAKAARQAVEAVMQKTSLNKYAKDHKELNEVLIRFQK